MVVVILFELTFGRSRAFFKYYECITVITFRVQMEVIECNKRTDMEMRGFSFIEVRQLGFEFFVI